MKKFSVILAAALTMVLILSTMVVGATAATVPNSGISCGSNISTCPNSPCAERAQCLFGVDLASRLGLMNLSRCANGDCTQQPNFTCAPGSCANNGSACANGSSANCGSTCATGSGSNSGSTCTNGSRANSGSTCTNGSGSTSCFNNAPGSSANSASKNAFVNGTGTAYPVSKTTPNSLNSIVSQYRTVIEKFCGTNYICPGTQTVKNPSAESGSGTAVTPPVNNNTAPVDNSSNPVENGGTPATDSNSAPADSGEAAEPTNNASIDNLSFEQQVVALVNEQRAANGLAPLALSQTLSTAARAKSQDMHDNNYFSHTSPTYGSPFDMLRFFGISYRTAGENIAMGYSTPEAVMTGWMNSAGHRANILNANYTQIGVGYVADGNYWTQEFIG